MKFLQAIFLLAFLGAVGIFAAQNTDAIPVRFLNYKLTAPVALVTVAAYLLGMLTGWTVVSFMTRSIRQVSERRTE